MWIRTSDKKRVIFWGMVGKLEASKYKDEVSEKLYETGVFQPKEVGYVLLNGECIGEYATEQRAIEVLDEICRTYEELNYVDRDTARGIVMNGIYQMPEE